MNSLNATDTNASNKTTIGLVALVCFLFASESGLANNILYSVTDLGTLPGGIDSVATGINNQGQVVGYAHINNANYCHAFLYSGGTMMDLGTLPGSPSYAAATAINSAGQVAGSTFDTNGYYHAFLWSGGTMTDLGKLMTSSNTWAYNSQAFGINDYGQVVGYSYNSSTFGHAFLYSGGTMVDLGTNAGYPVAIATGINNQGQVVGYWEPASFSLIGTHAFLDSSGAKIDLGLLPGGSFSIAKAINNNGQIAGYGDNSNGIEHAFLYSSGKMVDLGTLPGSSQCVATGINNLGQVVGYAFVGNERVFLYSGGTMMDVASLLPSIYSGWTLRGESIGINDSGQIACTADEGLVATHALLLTPISSIPITGVKITNRNVVLSFLTATNFLHDVQSTTNLLSTSWNTLVSTFLGPVLGRITLTLAEHPGLTSSTESACIINFCA